GRVAMMPQSYRLVEQLGIQILAWSLLHRAPMPKRSSNPGGEIRDSNPLWWTPLRPVPHGQSASRHAAHAAAPWQQRRRRKSVHLPGRWRPAVSLAQKRFGAPAQATAAGAVPALAAAGHNVDTWKSILPEAG